MYVHTTNSRVSERRAECPIVKQRRRRVISMEWGIAWLGPCMVWSSPPKPRDYELSSHLSRYGTSGPVRGETWRCSMFRILKVVFIELPFNLPLPTLVLFNWSLVSDAPPRFLVTGSESQSNNHLSLLLWVHLVSFDASDYHTSSSVSSVTL